MTASTDRYSKKNVDRHDLRVPGRDPGSVLDLPDFLLGIFLSRLLLFGLKTFSGSSVSSSWHLAVFVPDKELFGFDAKINCSQQNQASNPGPIRTFHIFFFPKIDCHINSTNY